MFLTLNHSSSGVRAENFKIPPHHQAPNVSGNSLDSCYYSRDKVLRLKWTADRNKNSIGNDSSKFCALPGGYRGKAQGFSGMGEFTYLSGSTGRDQKVNDIWGQGILNAESTIMRCGSY